MVERKGSLKRLTKKFIYLIKVKKFISSLLNSRFPIIILF